MCASLAPCWPGRGGEISSPGLKSARTTCHKCVQASHRQQIFTIKIFTVPSPLRHRYVIITSPFRHPASSSFSGTRVQSSDLS
jgi:hypothetical protein